MRETLKEPSKTHLSRARRGHGDVQAAQVVVINGGIFGKEEGRGREEMIKRE